MKGAIRIDPSLRNWQDLCTAAPDISKSKSINTETLHLHYNVHCTDVKEKAIFYCSVGYRSSAVVARLQRHKPDSGETPQLFNLEGSLFKWANEDREMVNCHNEPTPYCHPYSIFWGLLLNSQLRRREPEGKQTSNI